MVNSLAFCQPNVCVHDNITTLKSIKLHGKYITQIYQRLYYKMKNKEIIWRYHNSYPHFGTNRNELQHIALPLC